MSYVYILILINTSQNFNVYKTEAEKDQSMLGRRRRIEEPPPGTQWHFLIRSKSVNNQLQFTITMLQKPMHHISVLEYRQEYAGTPTGFSILLGGNKDVMEYCFVNLLSIKMLC